MLVNKQNFAGGGKSGNVVYKLKDTDDYRPLIGLFQSCNEDSSKILEEGC